MDKPYSESNAKSPSNDQAPSDLQTSSFDVAANGECSTSEVAPTPYEMKIGYSGLPQVVKRLGWVSFFADISSEMLYPITPIFLTVAFGASMASVGLIEGVAEATASILKAFSGRWADRLHKRKTFVWLGYLIAAIAKPGVGLSTSWWGVLGARAFDRTGKGLRSVPRDAWIADSIDSRQSGYAFGWHRAMDTLGAAIGPLAAILYLQHFGSEVASLRRLYFWALIPGLIAVLLVLVTRERTRADILTNQKSREPSSQSNVAGVRVALTPGFTKFLAAWTLFSLANSSDVFLLLRVKAAGVSTAWMIGLYCFYNLFYAGLSPYVGNLSDRISRVVVLRAGLLIFALTYWGIAHATTLPAFALWFAIYGVYMAATDGVAKALVLDLTPRQVKGTALGILAGTTGIATVFASWMSGLIWDQLGMGWMFAFASGGAVLAALLLRFVTPPGKIAMG